MTNKPTYWENGEPHEMADVRSYRSVHCHSCCSAPINTPHATDCPDMVDAEIQVDMEIAHERRQLGGW